MHYGKIMNINIDNTVWIDAQLTIGTGCRIIMRRQLGKFSLNAGLMYLIIRIIKDNLKTRIINKKYRQFYG